MTSRHKTCEIWLLSSWKIVNNNYHQTTSAEERRSLQQQNQHRTLKIWLTLFVWPNTFLTGVWKVRSLAKACVHCRGKQSSSAGWTAALSRWDHLCIWSFQLEVCLLFLSHVLHVIVAEPLQAKHLATFASKLQSKNIGGRGGETGRIGGDASTHVRSHQVLLFLFVFVPVFSFCPTSRSQTAAWISSWFHPVQKQTHWYVPSVLVYCLHENSFDKNGLL